MKRNGTDRLRLLDNDTETDNSVGHGLNQINLDKDFDSHGFEPKSDIPIKVIVLDDTQTDNDINALISDTSYPGYVQGTPDKERYDWLVSEAEKGQVEGKLMIIAAHIPIDVKKAGSLVGWSSTAHVSQTNLIAKLHEYPKLIPWIAEHRHCHTVSCPRGISSSSMASGSL